MSNHTILAPSATRARKVAHALVRHGFHARATKYGKHHVVLAIAPLDVVERECLIHSVGGL